MSDYKRIPTSAEVWAVIHARHKDELTSYGSFSDSTGTFNGGPGLIGRMETTYALAGTDFPIIEIRTTWEIHDDGNHRRNLKSEYWLCVAEID